MAQDDPLPSWNDGAAKTAIMEFVRATTTEGSPDFVSPESRIATFDQDGTLWVEQPLYTQVVFALDRVKALAPEHPEWKTTQPFQAILTDDKAQLADFSIQDFERIIAETHAGITVFEFHQAVDAWLATARHPRFKRPYTELVYQPMLEVMRFLRENGYRTYIVTGGGQEFVRAYAAKVYGVPPEQVVGSAARTKYEVRDGQPLLIKQPETILIDDGGGKVEGINLMIGRRPFAAFGNSTGDQQMLEWTQVGHGPRLLMLVHHDDATREYDYGFDSRVGTFTKALLGEARRRGWTVISMKDDWKRVFAFDE
jgi:phosphoserine phosphatase